MNISSFTHDDCLAHASLAATLGHGLHPWVMLDTETQKLAHELLNIDPNADVDRALLVEEPAYFNRWIAREEQALQNAKNIAHEMLPGTIKHG